MSTTRSRRLHRNVRELFGDPPRSECRVCAAGVDDHRKRYCSPKCRQVAMAVWGLYQWPSIRKNVLERDGYTCQNCGDTSADLEESLHVDHVVPLSQGGAELDERNLQALCADCNQQKGVDEIDHREPVDEREGVDVDVVVEQYENATAGAESKPAAVRVLDVGRFIDSEQLAENALYGSEPSPPEKLPQYVTEPIERQDVESLELLVEFAQERLSHLLAEAQREIDAEDVGGDGEIVAKGERVDPLDHVQSADVGSWGRIYSKKIPCGDDSCSKCPHGPYQYLFYRKLDGSLTSKYLGK